MKGRIFEYTAHITCENQDGWVGRKAYKVRAYSVYEAEELAIKAAKEDFVKHNMENYEATWITIHRPDC